MGSDRGQKKGRAGQGSHGGWTRDKHSWCGNHKTLCNECFVRTTVTIQWVRRKEGGERREEGGGGGRRRRRRRRRRKRPPPAPPAVGLALTSTMDKLAKSVYEDKNFGVKKQGSGRGGASPRNGHRCTYSIKMFNYISHNEHCSKFLSWKTRS